MGKIEHEKKSLINALPEFLSEGTAIYQQNVLLI